MYALLTRAYFINALIFFLFFSFVDASPGLLPVLGPLERYMTPTLDAALLLVALGWVLIWFKRRM